jgi:deoxyribonuclease V
MKACLDVHYYDTVACAAAVIFHDWTDATAADERTFPIKDVQPYQSGQFFRRELPCLLAVLGTLRSIDSVMIDGYVWLDGAARPGLGAHLFQALAGAVAVVGVAKTKFQGANQACEVTRGTSKRPLFVTAAGMEADVAASCVQSMHGNYRIPSLIARADYLCRNKCPT